MEEGSAASPRVVFSHILAFAPLMVGPMLVVPGIARLANPPVSAGCRSKFCVLRECGRLMSVADRTCRP